MFKTLNEDVQAFMERDPAARSGLEIVLCYPGYHALVFYRMTHWMWEAGWRLPARFLAHIAKMLTAIEIHPGATIGKRFVIDHGTGVVIGETSDIGDDVTIYHDVTLGGIAPSVDSVAQIGQKRHPTLCDGSIIGSGAAVLGPITIGEGAKIGANSVVTKSVEACMTAVGIPARVIMPKDKSKSKDFVAYGTVADGPDPVVQTIDELRRQMQTLVGRVAELEGELETAAKKPATRKKTKTTKGRKAG
jgi:serine O-acetyltransferase